MPTAIKTKAPLHRWYQEGCDVLLGTRCKSDPHALVRILSLKSYAVLSCPPGWRVEEHPTERRLVLAQFDDPPCRSPSLV